jgi:hypothetical protein
MINSNYSCTQAELYKACRFIWLLCQQYLTAFADYKSNYTTAYISENLALIQSIESTDNHEARKTPAIDFWKQLKGYCETAFKADTVLRDAMLGEAGQGYYDKITGGSWSDVAGLLSAMIPFVQNRKDILMEKGFMSAAFLTRLEENQATFKTAYDAWKAQNETVSPATETRITANNDLKNRAMEVLADGQRALIKDKGNAQKFVWTSILSEIRGTRPTGLGGKVTDAATKDGLANATVTIVEPNLTATTDKDGRYEFTALAEGTYTIEIKVTGYETLVVDKRAIKGGIKGRLNGEMKAN